MPRRPDVTLVCGWCLDSFTAPYKRRTKKTCSPSCKGHFIAIQKSKAKYRTMGRRGGKRSGQVRRQDAVKRFLKCVTGSMHQFATCLYILGFMHGQNTAALKFQSKLARLRGHRG